MDRDFEREILKKFDTVIKLLTISSLKDETQVQKIKILSSAGLSPKDIASLLGTSSNTVSVALSKMKNKEKSHINQDNSQFESKEVILNEEGNKNE